MEVKAQQYFVSLSYMFLDKKILLKIRLNPGLNLTICRGTGPWKVFFDAFWLSKTEYKSYLREVKSDFLVCYAIINDKF